MCSSFVASWLFGAIFPVSICLRTEAFSLIFLPKSSWVKQEFFSCNSYLVSVVFGEFLCYLRLGRRVVFFSEPMTTGVRRFANAPFSGEGLLLHAKLLYHVWSIQRRLLVLLLQLLPVLGQSVFCVRRLHISRNIHLSLSL